MAVSGLGDLLWIGVVLMLPGTVAAVLWSPFLVTPRVRSLFRSLPVCSSLPANYLLVMIVLSLPWATGTGISVTTARLEGAQLSNELLDVNIPLSVLYVLILPVTATIGLPRVGIHWAPADSVLTTWVLLTIGTAWYVVVFAGPLFLLAVILALPT